MNMNHGLKRLILLKLTHSSPLNNYYLKWRYGFGLKPSRIVFD